MIALFWLCITPAWSEAQEQAPDEPAAAKEQAQEFFDEAAADYMAKRYAQAALKFRKAYAYLPEATFLYNQARALDKLESYEQALKALEQAQAQQERPLPEELMQKAKPFEAELKEKIAKQNQPKPTVPQAPVDSGVRPLTWVGVGLVSLGVVAGAGALYLGGQATETEQALSPPQPFGQARYDELATDLESQRLWGQVALYSAVGLGLTGIGVWVWSVMDDEQEAVTLQVGPQGFGMRAKF